MVASKLDMFIRLEDNNGIVVGEWAESTETEGIARCKICKCDVNFKQVKFSTCIFFKYKRNFFTRGLEI